MSVHYDVDHEGRVAVVAIDRPQVRNAMDASTARAVETAVDRVEADPEVWVGILTGGADVFCAGADVRELAAGRAHHIHTRRGGFGGFVRLERTKPFIAAVEGPALAGGMEMVLACDLVVASASATFGLPEVRRSNVCGGGALFRLPERVSQPLAMEWLLTGDTVTAEQAHAAGLLNQLCPAGTALEHARALAARINRNAPLAVRATREGVLGAGDRADAERWQLSNRLVREVAASSDFDEGVRAFVEKRVPRWSAS
ncbi:enoyl-CoA hydratase [Nocardioides mangrovicus]|uniref:Enoyl-CoA hydratase n=1 Tax=Nocardioides mangrovicus TaxID=2478913 RepID=A0A3L8P518_9ACTN|nr:crotonase/enoyl-CoA hydratase family protein [Nocardioides mangrovicus]RLV50271.1 enoyl-CoA hydratase [Nocardioides mangrovicus]